MKLNKSAWKINKLGNVTVVTSGGTPKRERLDYFDGEITWLTPTEIPRDFVSVVTESKDKINNLGLKESSAKILPKGTVLFTSRATIGLIAIAGKELTTNQGFANFICDQNYLRNEFLAYWLMANVNRIKSLSTGTTFKEISKTTIKNLSIKLPPLEEQELIAALFFDIEQTISCAEKIAKDVFLLKQKILDNLLVFTREKSVLLNASDFQKIKFEDIAVNISERVEPKHTDLKIYVGLEHLDSDNLAIKRWGKPQDVIGTKLRVYKGDIIFGKRRAYLRKVAVASFDGIASAHSMVLRAKEGCIEREFLPFLMQSDEFMNRAVQISEGSLSPTIKWKTLAKQEFRLPLRAKQNEFVKLFLQCDKTIETIRTQIDTLKLLKQKLLTEILE